MTGAVLGTLQLGATPLATIPVVLPFNPIWASQANIVVQSKQVDS